MKHLLTIFLVLLLCASAYGTTIGSSDSRITIGAMTGPRNGAEQDDNIKASLDLLHGKMAAALATGGSIFYVDSEVAGSAGTSWGTAVGTIELAIAKCSDARGDLILVAPYHVETASTGTFDLDKDSVVVWGLGTGIAMPTISYDHTTDTVIMGGDGDNTTIHGIRFYATVTGVVSAIVVEAACTDWIIEDCVFVAETSTTDEFVDTIYVTTGSADRGIIRRNRFLGDVGANSDPQASINFIDCDFIQIYDNEFSGDIGDAHIFNENTASNYVSIHDNKIFNGYIGPNLDTTPCISVHANTTGWIADNICVTNVATPEDAIVAADCYLFNNYYSETEGTTGSILIGTATQKSGTYIVVTSAVTSSSIPNNTQSAGAVTGAAVGTLLLIEVYGNTGATTGLEGPTNFEMSVDNVAGLTGADAPIWTEAEAGLDNDIVWQATADATTSHLPIQLESGKKVYIHGDNGVGTGGGTCNFTLVFQRITDGAHITGNDGPS